MKKIRLITFFCLTIWILPLHAQVVSTFAGSGSVGSINGTGIGASFNYPDGVAVDGSGNVYVADASNNRIRKITPAGVVTTFAGSGSKLYADGTGTAASFNYPTGVAVDGSGNVYVADASNNRIRKITPAGEVSTLAGSGSNNYVDGTGIAASFFYPSGIALDASGNIYVADQGNRLIRKITPDGVVSTFAGSGNLGNNNGTGTAASFYWPHGIGVDGSGNLYVADIGNNLIRKITPAGVVSTFAGSGRMGYADGSGTAASFNYPQGVTLDVLGNVYVTESGNFLIRKITPAGVVTTLAGSGKFGFVDGTGTEASFKTPAGIAIDGSGNLYVADSGNNLIRKITGLPTGIEELTSVSEMKLYPVPAKQNLTLGLTLLNGGDLRFELINMSGIKVAAAEGNYGSGFNELTLSVGMLPAGIYVANVYFNGQMKSQKVIIE